MGTAVTLGVIIICNKIGAVIFLLLIQSFVSADTITVACSPWKPHYYSEDGVIKGTGYEIAKAVMELAKIDARFVVQPWKRVYNSGLKESNYMIACLGRVPKRENSFHWIGPITKTTYYNFYKLKTSKITLKSHKDLLSYKVGVMRGSLTHDFMKDMLHDKTQDVSKAEQLIQLLKKGRVDFILEATNVIENESKLANINPEIFEMALKGYGISINMALGKLTPLPMVQAMQQAYKTLQTQGKIILP